jgi:hypothetical protein
MLVLDSLRCTYKLVVAKKKGEREAYTDLPAINFPNPHKNVWMKVILIL